MSVGNCAIMGVAESRLGVVPDATPLTLQAEAARDALKDANISMDRVDGLFCAGRWGSSFQLQLAEYLGLRPRYSDATVVGGASFEFHVAHAAAAISAGLCEVALILYGSTQRSGRERSLSAPNNNLGFQFEAPFGMPSPVGAYALAANRHMGIYGTRPEDLAEVAVSAREWAALNPVAYRRGPLSVTDVLDSPLVCDPLHVLDCCLITDGGGAVVITSAAVARECAKPPVWVLGHGEFHAHSQISEMADLLVTPAAVAGKRAFEMAALGPKDMDVLEIYDSFTITVLLTLEALGFCRPGESRHLFREGRSSPGGDVALNTSGGGLSYCHPGMFGIFLLIEGVRQLRGECGDRQVRHAEKAVVSGTGGCLASNGTCILAV